MNADEKEKAKAFAKQILVLAVEQNLTFSEYSFALKEAEWKREKIWGEHCAKCKINVFLKD